MELKFAPKFTWQVMENFFCNVEENEVNLDNIWAFNLTREHYLFLLGKFLHHFKANDFTVNPPKCEWAIQETDSLWHWPTTVGLKPRCKKIDDILQLQYPQNLMDEWIFWCYESLLKHMAQKNTHYGRKLQWIWQIFHLLTEEMDEAFKYRWKSLQLATAVLLTQANKSFLHLNWCFQLSYRSSYYPRQ